MRSLLALFALLIFCPPVVGQAPQPVDRGFDYGKKGPFEFLAFLIRLDERGVKVVSVADAPENWIRKEHLPLLVQLLESKEPCASVGSMRSSRLVAEKDRKSSTVGHEAAYLIESFRHGLFPKYAVNSSSHVTLDRQALKKWWLDGGDLGPGPGGVFPAR